MEIFVKAKTKAIEDKIEKIDDKYYVVWTKALPQKGKANEKIREMLAEYFKIPFCQVILKKGFSSKNKIFDIIKE